MRRRALLIALLCFIPALVWPEPGIWNPNCRQGETFTRVITWEDSAGDLVNLTGYSAKIQLRDTRTGTVIDEFTDTTPSGITLGGAAGTITWTVTATETGALPVGSLDYDLRLTSGTSVVTYLLAGHLNVQKRITQ